MHIVEASANRLVFDVENVSTMHDLFITLFHPGEIQSIYFLDRESENVWRYYSIVRTGKNATRLIAGNESSTVNRAVAFYRYLVGIPTGRRDEGKSLQLLRFTARCQRYNSGQWRPVLLQGNCSARSQESFHNAAWFRKP